MKRRPFVQSWLNTLSYLSLMGIGGNEAISCAWIRPRPLLPPMAQPSLEYATNIPILRYQDICTIPLNAENSIASPLLRALALSPDGRYLGGAFDRYVTIWRLKDNQEDGEDKPEEWTEILTYRIDERSISEEITCLSWMSTGHVLIGSNIGDVKIVVVNADVSKPELLYLSHSLDDLLRIHIFKGFSQPASLYES